MTTEFVARRLGPLAFLAGVALLVDGGAVAHAQGGGPADEPQVRAALRGESAPIAEQREDDQVPPGHIAVRVVDEAESPIPGAAVELGVLTQGTKREKRTATTDGAGRAMFSGLAIGSGQAYRVNVPHGGAVYSSSPFQLPTNRGYDVKITRLPTTTDNRFLLQFLMRVYLELKEGRIRVVQQAQFANLGRSTYVFPKEGLEIVLPEQRLAFQTQPGMGDQRVVESEKGVLLQGSVPPGRVAVVWAFDMPLEGTDFAIRLPVPFRTYRYSIEADGPPGAKLVVKGFPEAIRHEEKGNQFLVTQLQVEPTEPQMSEVDVRLTGLPGPGPLRFVATGVAAIFLVLAGWLYVRGAQRWVASGASSTVDPAALAARREALLRERVALEREFRGGQVGPKYHARRSHEIVDELALLLRASGGPSNPRNSPSEPAKTGG